MGAEKFPHTQRTKSCGRETAIAGKITVTTAGTPVTPPDQDCGEGVTFIASQSNSGLICVYPAAGAKTDVAALSAGDSMYWPVGNLQALKIDASEDGQSVFWMGAV